MQRYGKWTEKEIKFLTENYPLHGLWFCVKRLDRTRNAVCVRASRLKLKRRRYWKNEEISFLRENLHKGSTFCAHALGRTPSAIKGKAHKLNLVIGRNGPRPSFEPSESDMRFLEENYAEKGRGWCAKQLGISSSCLSRLAKKLKLRVSPDVLPKLRCSQERRDRLAIEISGKGNFNWRGGTTPEAERRLSRARWRALAKEIRTRDNHVCRCCSRPRLEEEKELDVHHIIPWRYGGSDHPLNLICLCSSCHGWADRNLVVSISELQRILFRESPN